MVGKVSRHEYHCQLNEIFGKKETEGDRNNAEEDYKKRK